MTNDVLKHERVENDAEVRPYEPLSGYKIVWLFSIGCVVGFLLETVFCFFTKGHLESRRGMVYGPFNQVYGFGMVIMILLLNPLAEKKRSQLFMASALIGGTFEFLCSWLQERVLGTVSWDYTNDPFLSFGGRTNVLFMFYWGVLGVLLMRKIYPMVSRLIDWIPKKPGVVMARALACFLAFNMLISLAAVSRWQERGRGIEPGNGVESYLDEAFPDERLEKIYPSMAVVQ